MEFNEKQEILESFIGLIKHQCENCKRRTGSVSNCKAGGDMMNPGSTCVVWEMRMWPIPSVTIEKKLTSWLRTTETVATKRPEAY